MQAKGKYHTTPPKNAIIALYYSPGQWTKKYLNHFEGNKTKGGCLITYLICIVICIYSCKVYLCFLLHFLQNSMQRIWPCFSILGLQKFLESAIGQSMVVKIEHFFAAKMQLKCNRCPEASIDRPLTEVSSYMCS